MRLLREGGFCSGFALRASCFLGILWLASPSMLWPASPFPFPCCPALAKHPQHAWRWLVSCPVLEGSWLLLARCLHGARKAEGRTLLRAVSVVVGASHWWG